MMWPRLTTRSRPPALLAYRRLKKPRQHPRGLPLGLLSVWLGAATVSGAFLLRILCDVYRINAQWYIFAGSILGTLAASTGIGANFLRGQRAHGIGGLCLGAGGIILFVVLTHV